MFLRFMSIIIPTIPKIVNLKIYYKYPYLRAFDYEMGAYYSVIEYNSFDNLETIKRHYSTLIRHNVSKL